MRLELEQQINDIIDDIKRAQLGAMDALREHKADAAKIYLETGILSVQFARMLIEREELHALEAIRLHLNTIAINTWDPGDPQPRGLCEEEEND